MKGLFLGVSALAAMGLAAGAAQEPGKSPFREIPAGYELVHWDDLDGDDSLKSFWYSKADEWRFLEGDLDDGAGNVATGVGPALFFKSSRTYKSRVRAPQSIALIKYLKVSGNFVLEVEMMQTGVETAHRDLCIFFGFEGPERFFYNHLGKVPDPNSSNVFDVNRADRVRIGEVSKEELHWGRGVWHRVRLECEWDDARGGRVRTYFDDMETPLFDKPLFREAAGLLGLGSFDDAGAFRNLHIWAKDSSKGTGNLNPFGDEVVRELSSEGQRSGGLNLFGAGSAKVWILGEEYRVGMVRTVDGKVLTRESRMGGFFFDDGLDWAFKGGADEEELRKSFLEAQRELELREYRWVVSDAHALDAAPGLVRLDEAVVLECGLAVTAEQAFEPASSSGFSMEPIYGVKLHVGPAKESRSRYLAKKYRTSSGKPVGDRPEGIWRWTTDLRAAFLGRADPRPVLLAITPAGAPFSAKIDAATEANEAARASLAAAYRCLRVDPTLIAGPSVRWPASIPIDRRGNAKCLLLDGKGRILEAIEGEPTFSEFLARLQGK